MPKAMRSIIPRDKLINFSTHTPIHFSRLVLPQNQRPRKFVSSLETTNMITSLDQLDLNKRYTVADYMSWRFKERVELIRGMIFKMSPAPSRRHQAISRELLIEIGLHLRGSNCQVFDAPFDVQLSRNDETTIVQPDISVICDEAKLTDQGCTGAPDWIIEILSPGNATKEKKEKFELYEENGVREYWLVDPIINTVFQYQLTDEGRYIGSKPFVAGEKVTSVVIPDLVIDVEHILQMEGE